MIRNYLKKRNVFLFSKKPFYEKEVIKESYLKVSNENQENKDISKEKLITMSLDIKELENKKGLQKNEVPIPISPTLYPITMKKLKVGEEY